MVPVYVEKSGSGLVRVLDSQGQVFAGFLETRNIITALLQQKLQLQQKFQLQQRKVLEQQRKVLEQQQRQVLEQLLGRYF